MGTWELLPRDCVGRWPQRRYPTLSDEDLAQIAATLDTIDEAIAAEAIRIASQPTQES